MARRALSVPLQRDAVVVPAAQTALAWGISALCRFNLSIKHTIFSRVLYQLSYLAWELRGWGAQWEG